MDENAYKYLFPYEKIPAHSNILIYGAGTLGQDYYTQLSITHYCEVVGFVDKNYQKYDNCRVPVYSPDMISTLKFDYVVIALRMAAAFNEIKRILVDAGVSEDRIIAVFERSYEVTNIFDPAADDSLGIEYAFACSNHSIAFLTTGGFGDMVIQKKLITEIVRLVPDCNIDIYNIKAVDFLKILYTDVPNVKNIIPDLGSRYDQSCKKYRLGLTIEACHFIRVDHFNEGFWMESNSVFADKIKLLISRTSKEQVGISTPAHVTMFRRLYKGYNAYTGFNYDGVFDITDKKVNIPLDTTAKERYEQLGLKEYITVNCGNGDCADTTLVAKSWPTNYYDQLISSIKRRYQQVIVVQLGAENAYKIGKCDLYVLGGDFALVGYILKNSMLHIDIEGGLVHMASQLGTKCIVLFGPTVAEYYGYDNNINIRAGKCRNCWGLYTDVNKCARGMIKPECMHSITPEMVYKQVKKVLDDEKR